MDDIGPLPTPAELEILQVLWSRGPSTVAEVREALAQERPTGYTTALKLLQIMHAKGLATRDESARTHVYDAWARRRVVQLEMIEDLAERAFDGSVAELAVRAVAAMELTESNLQGVRKQIERLERTVRKNS